MDPPHSFSTHALPQYFCSRQKNSLFYYRSTPPIYLRTVLQGIGLLLLLLFLAFVMAGAWREGKKKKSSFHIFPPSEKKRGGVGVAMGVQYHQFNAPSSFLGWVNARGSWRRWIEGEGGGGETKAGCIGDFPFQPLSVRTAYAHAAKSIVVSLFPTQRRRSASSSKRRLFVRKCPCMCPTTLVPFLSVDWKGGDCVEMDHWDAYRSHLCFPLPPPAQYWPG